jgi:hypothetical protein
VRVFGEDGFFVASLNPACDSAQICRLLEAPNAVPVKKHGGKLVGIRLLSMGDDRGHSGERHGCSIVTTERVRDDSGQFVGSKKNLKHKRTCNTWGDLAVKARPETDGENQARELATPAHARGFLFPKVP